MSGKSIRMLEAAVKRLAALEAMDNGGAVIVAGIQANHAFSTNSGAVLVGSAGATIAEVSALANVGPHGRFRVIGTVIFENTAAAVHSLQLEVQTQVGSAVFTTAFSAPAMPVLSGSGFDSYPIQFDVTGLTGASVAIQILGIADASGAITVPTNGAQLTIQELA